MRTSVPRLHSVRFKDGRAPIRVVRPSEVTRGTFERSSKAIANNRPDMVGYAIVVWTRNGSTSVDCATNGVPIPSFLIPEFVRTAVADYVHTADVQVVVDPNESA